MMRFSLVLSLVLFAAAARAADDTTVPSAHDMLRASLAEASKAGKSGAPAVAPGGPITDTARALTEATAEKKNPTPPPASTGAATKAEAQKQPANVLPQVEVKKSRITETDIKLAKTDK
jgi:hypothetical protein